MEKNKKLVFTLVLLIIISLSSNFASSDYDPQDAFAPTITINFAGNLSDSGGPYWRPPGESYELDNDAEWENGYYTNDSRQSEDWIYIHLTVTDSDGVDEVKLHWLNGTTWTNDSWIFINTGGNSWEFNSSGNITTCEGYDYSFDIWANDTSNNINTTVWNKTGLGGGYTRRHVQLNCTSVNISYTPYYLYLNTTESGVYGSGDRWKEDRMHHDQGPNAGINLTDSGVMDNDIPNARVCNVFCGGYFGHWFDESVSAANIEIQNIYYHIWQSTQLGDDIRLSFQYGREDLADLSHTLGNHITTSIAEGKSTIVYGGGELEPEYNTTFTLSTELMIANSSNFTDNSIYEFYTYFRSDEDGVRYLYSVSNRSFTSFILFNVPGNATLQGLDNDSDGLTDYEELYITYTNPFISDTDNDGYSDSTENTSGSDPNNYTSYPQTPLPPEFISIDGNLNLTTVYSSTPTFNWSIISIAPHYHLQISTISDFSTLVVNISDICEAVYPTYYTSNSTTASFTLPPAYALSFGDVYYCRVRAYVET